MDETKNDNTIEKTETASSNNNLDQVEIPNQASPNIVTPTGNNTNQPPPFQPSQPVQTTEDPGKTLGIIGLILSFIGMSVVGLVLCIIGYKKSKAVGMKNTIALVGIWLNAISMVVVIFGIIAAIVIVSYAGLAAKANTSQAQSNALSTQTYSKVFNTDNVRYPDKMVDFNAESTPSADMSPEISLLNHGTTVLNESNGRNTIWYQYTGDVGAATGGRIMYWDYLNDEMAVYYLGDATASSTFTDLQ